MWRITKQLGQEINLNAHIYLHAALNLNVFSPCAAWHSRMHMGRSVMEDARAALVRGEMIMHHTYFWEEFIDEGGRPCGRVVKHFTLDIKPGGTEQPVCDCARVYHFVCVWPCESNKVQVAVRETECVGHVWACVCARVSNIPIHQSHKVGRPLPREKNEPCPMRSARCCCSPATISSWFTTSGYVWDRHTSPHCLHKGSWHAERLHTWHVDTAGGIVSCKSDPTWFCFVRVLRGWLWDN